MAGTFDITLINIESDHYETATSVDWSLPDTMMGDTTWKPTIVPLEDENDWTDNYWEWDLIEWLAEDHSNIETSAANWYGEQLIWDWTYTF